jgi:probable rRNA maturation factor
MRSKREEIKDQVLGKKYNLSVVSAKNSLMKKLNKRYRNKNKTADVLSFPLSKTDGEIFLNESFAKKKSYMDYLFVHSILHLKGFKHGKKMEENENKIMIKHYGKEYHNWN